MAAPALAFQGKLNRLRDLITGGKSCQLMAPQVVPWLVGGDKENAPWRIFL
jgi:hypothetical protein